MRTVAIVVKVLGRHLVAVLLPGREYRRLVEQMATVGLGDSDEIATALYYANKTHRQFIDDYVALRERSRQTN